MPYYSDHFKLTVVSLHIILTITFISFTDSSSSDNCDAHTRDCVCNIRTAVLELTKILSNSHQSEIDLENQIRSFKCSTFTRLPTSLLVESIGVSRYRRFNYKHRKRLRRVKRQVTLGVPTDDVFESAIAHLSPTDPSQYAILGSFVAFYCANDMESHDAFETFRKFKWTHYDGTPVTASETSVDMKTGTLSFASVQLTDIDVYNCTLESETSDTGIQVKQYVHQLFVVSEPIFWLKMHTAYHTPFCNKEDADLIRNHLEIWIERTICPICKVHNATVGCHKSVPHSGLDYYEDETDEGQYSYYHYEISLAISAIGVELQIKRLNSCPISCLEAVNLQIMEIVRNSAQKLSYLPIEISVGAAGVETITHDPIVEAFDMHLRSGCLGGFSYTHKLCFPCTPGTFSPEDSSECFSCHVGSYQDYLGSTYCKPCPDQGETIDIGSTSVEQCISHSEALVRSSGPFFLRYLWLFIIFLLVLLLMFILLGVKCCCPRTSCGLAVSRFCCCCCPWHNDYSGLNDNFQRMKRAEDVVKYSELKNETSRRNSREKTSRVGRNTENFTIRGSTRQHSSPSPNNDARKTVRKVGSASKISSTRLEEESDSDSACIDDGKTHSGHGLHRCRKQNSTKSILQKAVASNKYLVSANDPPPGIEEICNMPDSDSCPPPPPPKPPPLPTHLL